MIQSELSLGGLAATHILAYAGRITSKLHSVFIRGAVVARVQRMALVEQAEEGVAVYWTDGVVLLVLGVKWPEK